MEQPTPAAPATPAPAPAPVAATPDPTPAPATAPPSDHTPAPDADLDAAILGRLESAGLSEEFQQSEEAPATEEPAPAATTPEEDALAAELGIDPRRNNRIPYAKVKKIIANAEKKLADKLAAEHQTALGERETKISAFQRRIEEVEAVEQIMESEPERFLQLLAAHPSYAPLLSGLRGQAPNAPADRGAAPAAEMPKPNLQLPDGSLTYDINGVQSLLDWNARQVEARLMERMAPVLRTAEAEQRMQAAIPQVRAQLDAAHQWPGFAESKEAILDALRSDPRLSLHDAYIRVVVPKLQGNRDKMRQELITELQAAPAATSAAPAAPTPANTGDGLDARIKARARAAGINLND